jgi:hypothetical protein
MTRIFNWVAGALVLSLSLLVYENRAIAQEASADADANASAAEAEASADTNASADANASESNDQADAQASSSDNLANADTSASADTSSEANAEAEGSVPPPSNDQQNQSADAHADVQGTTDANANANTDARQSGQAGPALPPPGSTNNNANQRTEQSRMINRDATDQQRTDAQRQRDDRSFDGRANVGDRSRGGRDRDLRAGIEFGRRTDRGLAINNIERNSFYYDSGFRRGDIIVSVHGRPVYSDADFVRFMVIEPGQRVPVIVLRDGRRETIYVQYQDVAHTHHEIHRDRYQAGGAYLGVVFDAQARDAAVVLSVNPGSPAQEAGIQSGDIIVALNGQEVRSYPDVITTIRGMRPGEELQLIVERSRAEREMLAVLDAQPNVRTAGRPDVRVERETTIVQPAAPADRQFDNRYRDDRGLDRDRDYDGNRRILPRLRN